jgi:hypothetical protein
MGKAGDQDKFNQPIKGFDCYLACHWLLLNSNKASLPTPFLRWAPGAHQIFLMNF